MLKSCLTFGRVISIVTPMKEVINHLAGTVTYKYRATLLFRLEVFRVEEPTDVQITRFYGDVFLLRWPNGMAVSKRERLDTSFRQQWLLLDDFPRCEGSRPEAVVEHFVSAAQKYGSDYLAKYDTGSSSHSSSSG